MLRLRDRCARAISAIAAAVLAGPSAAGAQALEMPPAVPVVDGKARVTLETTEPIPTIDRRLARFSFAGAEPAPVVAPDARGEAERLLRKLYAEGKAAGNRGDLYDNRDRGHSRLPAAQHPQLSHTTYGEKARDRGLNYGLVERMIFAPPTIGNSSTALTAGPLWRSLPRKALTEPGGARRLYQDYAAGQIYVYPEHRDHDPKHGDLIPANTPYLLISQGSSGSDRKHLKALATILAAFRPDTKARLIEEGLIAPTVQMVFRRGQKRVHTRAGYLSGLAHPSVFPGDQIALARMVRRANSIAPGAIPPMVRLDAVEDISAEKGVDYFGDALGERLFDTPSAIARVWRSKAYRRSMVVSAGGTRDPNGRALEFTWAVLRGDPEHTRIEKLTPDGRRARITVEWQNPRPVPGRPKVRSNRIDIGVFANNGAHDSAPAFISFLLPHHETRVYERGPDGATRIASLDRRRRDDVYADPVVFPRIPWRDEYHYDAAGRLTGWTRHRDGETSGYTAEGAPTGDVSARRPVDGPPSYSLRAEGADELPRVVEQGRATSGG